MFKQLKLWKNIVTLNSKFVLIQATTYVVSVFCAIISPIALSYFISFVSSSEFSLALLWLGIDLAIKLLEQLSWHFNYSNFTPLIAPTYLRLHESLVMTALSPIDKNIKNEFDYVVSNDLYTISSYIDKLLFGICNFLKLVIITIIIFIYSYAIGTIILAVSILGYFILTFYVGQRRKTDNDLYLKELSLTKKFGEIQKKHDVIKKYNLEKAVFFGGKRRVEDYVGSYYKTTNNRSIKDNIIQIYWNVMLAICLAILVFEFRKATLSLTLFLAIYNYLLMYTSITRNVFDFKLEINELAVALGRFKNVISTEQENKKPIIDEIYSIEIPKLNARINAKEKSIEIPVGSVVLFKGREYKKLFLTPVIDFKVNNIDISKIDFDYVCKVVSYDNEMFDDSIIENLQIINPDLKQISNVIKLLDLNGFINSLPDKEMSNISETNDRSINFKLNLAKAILSNSKVIFLNVSELKDEDLSKVFKTIIIMRKTRIFLVYDENNRINRKNVLIVE